MNVRMRLSTAQNRLALLWLLGAALIFVFVLAQTVGGKYGARWQQPWAWFLPTVMPTLSLIVGGVVFASRDRATASKSVDRSIFWLAYLLSAFYLVVVLGTLLMQPLSSLEPLEFIAASNVWLGAIQSIVGLALGAFFTSKE